MNPTIPRSRGSELPRSRGPTIPRSRGSGFHKQLGSKLVRFLSLELKLELVLKLARFMMLPFGSDSAIFLSPNLAKLFIELDTALKLVVFPISATTPFTEEPVSHCNTFFRTRPFLLIATFMWVRGAQTGCSSTAALDTNGIACARGILSVTIFEKYILPGLLLTLLN